MKSVLEQYYEAFNAGKWEEMLSLLTEDVVHEVNESPTQTGKSAFRGFLAKMDKSYQEQVVDLFIFSAEGNHRAAAEFFIEGKYLVTDEGLPEAKGQPYRLRVGAFFEFRDGLISRVTNHYNLQHWLEMVSK
jgi:steroid delta-isomerase-like uncharacterized protein